MRAPRILMLIELYPPEYTGAGTQLQSLAPFLVQQGARVKILASTNEPKDESYKETTSVDVIKLAVSKGRFRELDFARKARQWIRNNTDHFDIVHAHGASHAALLSTTPKRKPLIIKATLMGTDDPLTLRHSRFGSFKHHRAKRAAAWIATTKAMQDASIEAGLNPERVHRIPNGVNINRFKPLPADQRNPLREDLCAKTNWDPAAPLVLFLGSIEPRKGVDQLLHAWGLLNEKRPEARLLIVGPVLQAYEQFSANLKTRLHEKGLDDTVHFTGGVNDPERYLQAADLFVFPSRREGMPNAVLEAQACGTPCIASDISGIRDDVIIDGETGVLVEPENQDDLAAAMLRLLDDNDLRSTISKRALDHVRASHSLEAVAKSYMNLYKNLMENG